MDDKALLEKLKKLGVQMVTHTEDAVSGMTSAVRGQGESIGAVASSVANSVTHTLNDKAVRMSTAEICNILEIAMDELRGRPLSQHRVSLIATVNIGVASLEMQVHVDPPPEFGLPHPAVCHGPPGID